MSTSSGRLLDGHRRNKGRRTMGHDDLDAFEDMTPESDRMEPSPVERTGPSPLERTRRSTRVGISVPGAIGGVLLIGAMAFGANLGLVGSRGASDATASTPAASTPADDVALVDQSTGEKDDASRGQDADDPTRAPDATDESKPTDDATKDEDGKDGEDREDAEPTKKPDPEPTRKPKPTEKPDPKPTKQPALDLALAVKEGVIQIKWSTCEADGAEYYKVVRSSDSTVKWPLGDGDDLIAVVEIGGTPKAQDEKAPAGKKAWYRVFCVRSTDAGYKILAASETGSIVAPADDPEPTPKPTPEPYAMWMEAGQDGGAVHLSWEACESDGFSHYRILRKSDGGTDVIAEVDDRATTSYVDDAVEPGVTYKYAVQAKAKIGGQWVLLGTTEWVAVTVE